MFLELPSLITTGKRDKTKRSSNFGNKVMEFLPKKFSGVFELPLPRNALIRKKSQEQKSRQARAASKNTKTQTRTKKKSRQKNN
jgi:hypothetical protein